MINKIRYIIESGKNIGSTSEMITAALSTGREDLLPAPYTTISSAVQRLSEEQREVVNQLRRQYGLAPLYFPEPSIYA